MVALTLLILTQKNKKTALRSIRQLTYGVVYYATMLITALLQALPRLFHLLFPQL